ncbi:MgtC/SapB family protein [Methylovirgula sp. 4M-Z18]|uniref:MgtC/SapB family protein n=1 Tax=Methylovirgula sp. 4M-Z18 TaxID=2293567 RepID=UPI000E2FCC25|nr:MgtC/SapB family protein [Methylovirgula sp. 4M-Z18]RFB76565.1 DUF4010 domain-containing protein [Methylovirgula sp. 4M-Z18]
MDALLARLGLALAIGLLIGLERGWRERDAPDRSRTAGIRTYGISGLVGGIFAALAQALDAASVLVAGFFGFAAVFTLYKLREAAHDEDFSATGVIAGLGVFALGAMAVVGDYQAAAGAAAALAAVLASREVLHELLKRLTWVELRSALILSVMTAIILPLLPNRAVDPWDALNPRQIWFFTVLTAGISYFGYIAVRLLGTTRGLIVSALTGAVISSTAVTLALGRGATTDKDAYPLAGAASLAAAVSIARVGAIVAVVQPQVLLTMGPTACTAALGFCLCGLVLLIGYSKRDGVSQPIRSPFELGPLFLFASLFAVVAIVNAALASHIGTRGLLATSAISGAIDVDVAALSALRLVGTSATAETGADAVLSAIAINSLLRLVVAIASGPARFWMPLLVASGIALGLGSLTFALLPSF